MTDETAAAVETKVRAFLKSRFPGFEESVAADASLESFVDSLGVFDVAEWVEQTFRVRIPNEEFTPRRFATVGSIVRTIQEFR